MACALTLGLAGCYSRSLAPASEEQQVQVPGRALPAAAAAGSSPQGSSGAAPDVPGGPAPAPLADASNRPAPLAQRLALPAPCAGLPYRELLQPLEPGPIVWTGASQPPPGLQLDLATGVLSGTPQAGGNLQVSGSAGGRELRFDIDLSLRDSCWFAVLSRSSAGAPPQLHLRDVFATVDIVLGAGEPISDFAFSPDGAWIAFRAGAAGAQRLFTVAIPDAPRGATLPAAPLAFDCAGGLEGAGCSVLEYSWSPDSRRLAVALRTGDGRDALAIADAASGVASPLELTVDWAGTRLPLLFGGQLTWGGADWLGFWGLEAEVPAAESQVFHLVTLEAGRPALGALLAEFGAGPSLRAIPGGLALSYADSTLITALSVSAGEPPLALRRAPGVLSPSGRLVATASDEGRLQITELSGDPQAAPVESARESCGAIVAWSARLEPGVERILCTQGTSLRLFDYVAAGAAAPRLEREAGEELGAAPDLLATRRIFSASGRFLLLADASSRQLALHDLQAEDVNRGLPFELPALAEFAPARDALALANGESLAEYGLPRELGLQRTYATFGGAGPALGARCSEAYWPDPERWCGAPRVPAYWSYSPRAQSLLFEGPLGQLSLADVSMLPQRDARAVDGTLAACTSPCRSVSYTFRPEHAAR